jgi:hypothetical protein
MSRITGSDPMQGKGMAGMYQPTTLSDAQKKSLQSILSQYDPKNLTSDQAGSIFEQLRKVGIQPGQGLKDALESAGFDPLQMRKLIMEGIIQAQKGQLQSTQNNTNGINTSALQTLKTILEQYDLNNLTKEDQNNLMSNLKNAGLLQGGNILNLGA